MGWGEETERGGEESERRDGGRSQRGERKDIYSSRIPLHALYNAHLTDIIKPPYCSPESLNEKH